MENKTVIVTLKGVREKWVVPPGLGVYWAVIPPLKRWAKMARPYGARESTVRAVLLRR